MIGFIIFLVVAVLIGLGYLMLRAGRVIRDSEPDAPGATDGVPPVEAARRHRERMRVRQPGARDTSGAARQRR
ncbi:MAG: hypothetical protein JWN62_3241 [Acidimicrobiales bacterium]|nr:hypothetical protein [Acidimicrobiales bacterium]